MAEIVDFEAYKQRKLAKAVEEWNSYLSRSEKFRREGKHKFADEMFNKAKEVRKLIDKLRGSIKIKTPESTVLKFGNHDAKLTFTFDGHATADLGYPRSTPETTPPASA